MDEAISEGIGERGFANALMPVLDGELAGDDRSAGAVAIFEQFEEIATLIIRERSQAKVIEHE